MVHCVKRKEEKFLLTGTARREVLKSIKEFINYSEYHKNGTTIDVRTTYLESDSSYIYYLKHLKEKERFKIRIREYGINNRFKDRVWVELKEKLYGRVYKHRFRLSKNDVVPLLNCGDVFGKILIQNKKLCPDYLRDLYNFIQRNIEMHDLYPRVVAQYSRIAFQDKKSIRVTLDNGLKSYLIPKGGIFKEYNNRVDFNSGISILELKTIDSYPEDIKDIIRENNLNREKFSKFVFAAESQNIINKTIYRTKYTPHTVI